MKCGQITCDNEADYRYTWPGRDECFVCEKHKAAVEQVAKAMGMYIQLIPLQKEKEDEAL